MKSREEFIAKWRTMLAGLALYGLVSETRDSTLSRASRALDIPREVERILGMMYTDLAGESGRNGISTAAPLKSSAY